jgi:hypothetical protein
MGGATLLPVTVDKLVSALPADSELLAYFFVSKTCSMQDIGSPCSSRSGENKLHTRFTHRIAFDGMELSPQCSLQPVNHLFRILIRRKHGVEHGINQVVFYHKGQPLNQPHAIDNERRQG